MTAMETALARIEALSAASMALKARIDGRRQMNTTTHTASAAILPALIASEVLMASLSFPAVSNNAMLEGSLAAPKQFFGDNGRYAVAPIHTRFDAVEWFVWDAEHALSTMNRAEVIRQSETLEEALRGL